MKERIVEFLKTENKTSAQFAEEIGVQPSGISHIISGRNNPSLDFVVRMLERYPSLSMEWLLFGKGKMYREPVMKSLFDNDLTEGKKAVEGQNPEKKLTQGENAMYLNTPAASAPDNEPVSRVSRIVWFYSDGSFQEFYPSIKSKL